ncbi:hypothetical protein F4806DRAFT_483593 [Annulohypoxylon nitens]|nr:hypothetical protein F4806DRAFT_483593 [Annulohypoxylon nitens]
MKSPVRNTSNSTLNEGKPTQKLRWCNSLVALLIWPIIHFLQQASSLLSLWGILPSLVESARPNPGDEPYADDHQRLLKFLRESKEQATPFISVDVCALDLDSEKVTDIGVSTWCPHIMEGFNINSFYWRIKDNIPLEDRQLLNKSDIFNFGNTELIESANIAENIDDIVDALQNEFPSTVIVGHDFRSTSSML